MKLDSIRIILVATSHPGNIGSTARAMKTMGFTRLYLVSPKLFPNQKAEDLAVGADDVLHHAVVTDTLAEALLGCHLVLATSARSREIALPVLDPHAAASLVASSYSDAEVAIVFGREHAGLTNDELLHCHYHINILTNPQFSSLNLSHAVQIVVYELRVKLISSQALVENIHDSMATSDEVEQFYVHLREVLIAIEFLKPSNPKKLMQRLRRMFNRINIEKVEINILRGILSEIQYKLKIKAEKNE
jgi:tRNA (cytidine32/uridine32-2'-O)-methyltransferase